MYKKIEIFKNDYSKNYNRDFNEKILAISDHIFQTQAVFPVGYMPIGVYRKEQKQFAVYRDEKNMIDSSVENVSVDESWNKLSEYEKIIASHLLYGRYDTYIFAGGMGTGKTTTATHVLDFIQQKYSTPKSAFIKISFDFNLGVLDSIEEIVRRFANELYEKLRVRISLYIAKRDNHIDIVRNFVNYIKQREYENYHEFFDLEREVNNLIWLEYKNDKRADVFKQYVEKNNDLVKKIEMLMKFLGFIRIDNSEDDFIIIFYDNIDVLDPLAQTEIFGNYILPLNSISKTKCLISLRRTTFMRNIDINDNQFAHSFGFIHHHGHNVSDIINQRLNYWKSEVDKSLITDKIEKRLKDALKQRIEFLDGELNNSTKNSISLKEFINAISGNSVRLGLFMCNRLLVNNIIEYDKNVKQRDRYKKALIVSKEDNLFLPNSSEIFNLFNCNDRFSLLPVKILQIVEACNDEGFNPKIKSLISNDKINSYCSDEDFVNSLRWMLYAKRPLMYTDKVHNNNSINLEASLFLTEIGSGYKNTLALDLTYLQEAFAVVKWDSDIIPDSIDIQNEFERLSMIVKCLRVAFDEEKSFEEFTFNTIPIPKITPLILEKVFPTIVHIGISNPFFRQLFETIESHVSYIIYQNNQQSRVLEELLQTISKFLR